MAKLSVSDPAPDFELRGTGDRVYRLSDYRGTGVILAFYPGDFTAVCTRQFCSYRDDTDRLAAIGVEVLGISPQSIDSHERFARKHGLTVPLLSDMDRAVAKDYGVSAPGGLVRRAIFLVDAELVIRHRDVKLLGLSYESAADLERAVASLG